MKTFKILLFLVFTICAVFCFFNIYNIFKEEQDNEEIKEELIEKVEIPEVISEEPAFKVDFEELQNINKDIVGWIVIEGTQVNYPIVQGKDNSYYLNHSYEKKWSGFGSIFMDSSSSNDFSDYNTFIYGHHTKDGSMFGEIYKYLDVEFYKEHPYFYLYTPNVRYKAKVFSAYVDSSDSDSYRQLFSSKDDYKNYLNKIIKKGRYSSDAVMDFGNDKIITLYSCSREGNWTKSDRYFIHAVLEEF